jgi:hypothetical protein
LSRGHAHPAKLISVGRYSLRFVQRILPIGVLLIAVSFGTLSFAQSVNCTCRYQGEDFGIGDSICLKGSDGLKMATCSMVLNNTSWQFSNAPCPLTEFNGTGNPDLEKADEDPIKQSNWQKTAMFNFSSK